MDKPVKYCNECFDRNNCPWPHDCLYKNFQAKILERAAPAMLEALEAMLKRFEPETHDSSGCMFKDCELCKANVAIKAAKGE